MEPMGLQPRRTTARLALRPSCVTSTRVALSSAWFQISPAEAGFTKRTGGIPTTTMVNIWLLVVNAWLMDGFYIIYIYTYLVGGVCIPRKNHGVRQLGLWHSQLNGNSNKMFQTTNQRNVDLTWFHRPWRFKYQGSKLVRLHGDVLYT